MYAGIQILPAEDTDAIKKKMEELSVSQSVRTRQDKRVQNQHMEEKEKERHTHSPSGQEAERETGWG